jgi:hypothetical protein
MTAAMTTTAEAAVATEVAEAVAAEVGAAIVDRGNAIRFFINCNRKGPSNRRPFFFLTVCKSFICQRIDEKFVARAPRPCSFLQKTWARRPCHEQLKFRDYKSQKFFPMC